MKSPGDGWTGARVVVVADVAAWDIGARRIAVSRQRTLDSRAVMSSCRGSSRCRWRMRARPGGCRLSRMVHGAAWCDEAAIKDDSPSCWCCLVGGGGGGSVWNAQRSTRRHQGHESCRVLLLCDMGNCCARGGCASRRYVVCGGVNAWYRTFRLTKVGRDGKSRPTITMERPTLLRKALRLAETLVNRISPRHPLPHVPLFF